MSRGQERPRGSSKRETPEVMARAARLRKELERLAAEPPEGICAWPRGEDGDAIDATIRGPVDTPYDGGEFRLEVVITERYPFEPPRVRFLTPVYHPNIDSGGRVCLDTLKMPPAGSWQPSVSLPSLLSSVRLLMAHPNPDDGLMPDISKQCQMAPSEFARCAAEWTQKHAVMSKSPVTPAAAVLPVTAAASPEHPATAHPASSSEESAQQPVISPPTPSDDTTPEAVHVPKATQPVAQSRLKLKRGREG